MMDYDAEQALNECLREIKSDSENEESDVAIGVSRNFMLYWEHFYFNQHQILICRSGVYRSKHASKHIPMTVKDCRSLFTKPWRVARISETRMYFKVEDGSLVPLISNMDTVQIYKKTRNNIIVMVCIYHHLNM